MVAVGKSSSVVESDEVAAYTMVSALNIMLGSKHVKIRRQCHAR
jgi:hypothetical protein